jgi:CRP-like cAMP-binding protein
MARSATREIVTALQKQSAFADCDKKDLEDLANHANQSSVPSGWSLIHQETPADATYIILDGTADVSVKGKKVATLKAGAVVGEVGVAGHKLRNATVTSTSAMELLHIDASEFTKLIDRRPGLKSVLLARTKPAAKAAADA